MEGQPFSGDSSLLKSINKATLLSIIRYHAPISRADLAKRTNLTRATVSALIEELIREHLVTESGIGRSSGGRRPVMLEVNGEAGYVFGIDLRPTEMLFIATNLKGNKTKKRKIEYEDARNMAHTLKQIEMIVREERRMLPASPLGLQGVGIGIHGFVEASSSRILFAPYFGWRNGDWKKRLEDCFGLPFFIDNEANLAALGEFENGVTAERAADMLYLSAGAGIGAGMILGGELFRGNTGFAGEVGHTTIDLNGKLCSCGNFGCLEMYASEKALADALGLPYKPGITERIKQLLETGNPQAHRAIAEVGKCLGIGIGNMVHTLNPQRVVIGNPIGQYEPWLHPYIEEAMQTRFPMVQSDTVNLHYSRLEDEACALGAASQVIRNIMRTP